MARARLPAAAAEVSAAAAKNPQRFRGRKSPKADALGGPSAHLSLYGKRAWERFRRELPWLKESHRGILEIASELRGQLLDPGVVWNLKTAQELRRCLGQLGATPADESKITLPDGDEEDPEEALFGRPPGGARPH